MKHLAVYFIRATRRRHQPKKKPEEKDQVKRIPQYPLPQSTKEKSRKKMREE